MEAITGRKIDTIWMTQPKHDINSEDDNGEEKDKIFYAELTADDKKELMRKKVAYFKTNKGSIFINDVQTAYQRKVAYTERAKKRAAKEKEEKDKKTNLVKQKKEKRKENKSKSKASKIKDIEEEDKSEYDGNESGNDASDDSANSETEKDDDINNFIADFTASKNLKRLTEQVEERKNAD